MEEPETGDTPLEAAWEHIENWLSENAPFTLVTLNEGATERDIWACEAAVGFRLPAEVAESWRIHNGQAESILIAETQLLPLAGIAAQWQKCMVEISYWKPQWLPIASDADNRYSICFDVSTPASSTAGAIIAVQHDEDSFDIFAASFTEWLQSFAKWLDASYYEWSEDADGLVIL